MSANAYCPDCGGKFALAVSHGPGGRVFTRLTCQHCGISHRQHSPRLKHQGRSEALYLESLHRPRRREYSKTGRKA